ncbi:MAG: DUF1189 family protein [Elusimicrobia bacterium]|nr:DUF1189 family protein [Elusimicrobiota bacterium]
MRGKTMILDPINSITSVNFYRKVAAQSVARSMLYLVYLALIFSLAGTIAWKLKVEPIVVDTFQWLETQIPAITFSNGRASSSLSGPTTVRHPNIAEIAFTIDTQRTEPVTPQTLQDSKVLAYLTANALYLQREPGRVEVYPLTNMQSKPVIIDSAFYRSARSIMSRVLTFIVPVVILPLFFLWKTLSSLFYSLIALLINGVMGASLGYGSLFSISVYAQTIVIALQTIFLFMPRGIPLFPFIAVAVTGTYIWLAIRKNAETEPART